MSKISKDPLVSVIMGSKSDLDTMRLASEVLRELEIPHETKIISAHRTPDLMFEFAKKAKDRGIKVIIAGAGGAAHCQQHGRAGEGQDGRSAGGTNCCWKAGENGSQKRCQMSRFQQPQYSLGHRKQ